MFSIAFLSQKQLYWLEMLLYTTLLQLIGKNGHHKVSINFSRLITKKNFVVTLHESRIYFRKRTQKVKLTTFLLNQLEHFICFCFESIIYYRHVCLVFRYTGLTWSFGRFRILEGIFNSIKLPMTLDGLDL